MKWLRKVSLKKARLISVLCGVIAFFLGAGNYI